MTGEDQAGVAAELHGTDGDARWVVGEYDQNPLHIDLSPELIDRLADGGNIANSHLARLAGIVTRKINRGEGRFGRRHPDGKGMLVLTVHENDWDEQA